MTLDEVEKIAQTAHGACRKWAEAHGDYSTSPWRMSTHADREQYRDAVMWALEHPDDPAGAMHTRWLVAKREAGFRWGAVKDAFAKTHPNLLPFEELPLAWQKHHRLFIGVVRALR